MANKTGYFRFFRLKAPSHEKAIPKENELMACKNNIDDCLRNKDYPSFRQNFSMLLNRAENCDDALQLVNQIHFQISLGASERILPKERTLDQIQVSETMFNLYLNRQTAIAP